MYRQSTFTDSSGLMKPLKAFMHDLLIQIAVILRAILHLSNENSRRIWARKRKAISQLKRNLFSLICRCGETARSDHC